MTPPRQSGRSATAGFTLVEVIVVISIVVALTGVCYTAGKGMITRARIIGSTANLRSLAIANIGYLSDHGTYAPAADRYNNRRWHGTRSATDGRFDPREGLLAPYLGRSMQVNYCPLLKSIISGSQSFEDGTGGYGYNSSYIGGRPGGGYDRTTLLLIPARPSQIPDPGNTVMFTTTAYALANGVQEYAYCEPPFWDYGFGPSGHRPSPSVHFRANGKALVAWCDGKVTAEQKNSTKGSTNPHGGDSDSAGLGWFGPEERNGYWNPDFRSPPADSP